MEMENILEQTLHCDGYYFDKVCPSRGEPDYGETGSKQVYYECKTHGQCPLYDYDLCRHCVEIKHYLRRKPRNLNSRVRSG